MKKLYISCYGENLHIVDGSPAGKNLSFKAKGYGRMTLPGLFTETARKPELVKKFGKEFKQFLKSKKLRSKNASIALGQRGIIVRSIKVPKMTPGDLDKMLKMEAGDYLTVSIEDYAFQYKLLAETEENGQKYYDVLLVAVLHSQIEQLVEITESAGLKLDYIDVLPNILFRLFKQTGYKNAMLVQSGTDGTSMAIFKDHNLFIYTDIPFKYDNQGGNDYSTLFNELRGYLDFFASRNFGNSIDNILILGELAGVDGLAEKLKDYFDVPVACGFKPFSSAKIKGRGKSIRDSSYLFAENFGLMLRDRK